MIKVPSTYTPTEWLRDNVRLTCSKCGEYLFNWFGEFKQVEEWAERAQGHICGDTKRKTLLPLEFRISKAREVMQTIRKNQPGLSFEESMERYRTLIKIYKLHEQ